MRVLIGCEFSGIVRSAFRALGHDAWSCDLLPAEDNSPHHIERDVGDVLERGWDLAIFHPPCTYLANSGAKHLYRGMRKENGVNGMRWALMEEGCRFFRYLLDAPIPHIAVENPIMHGHAAKLVGEKQSQIIQPWMFGHGETKATCLWLKNLPILEPTDVVEGREARVHRASPGPDRWKERSRTLPGIAKAMASQWGELKEMRCSEPMLDMWPVQRARVEKCCARPSA